MSRYCEEYHCLPSQAVAEIEEGPTQLGFDGGELRAYANAKHAVEQVYEAGKRAAVSGGEMPDLPDTPMVRLVVEIMREIEG